MDLALFLPGSQCPWMPAHRSLLGALAAVATEQGAGWARHVALSVPAAVRGARAQAGLSRAHLPTRCLAGMAVLQSTEPLALGRWHRVSAERSNKDGTLVVDGSRPVKRSSPGKSQGLNLRTPMFLGGVDPSVVLPVAANVSAHFHGCVGEVRLAPWPPKDGRSAGTARAPDSWVRPPALGGEWGDCGEHGLLGCTSRVDVGIWCPIGQVPLLPAGAGSLVHGFLPQCWALALDRPRKGPAVCLAQAQVWVTWHPLPHRCPSTGRGWTSRTASRRAGAWRSATTARPATAGPACTAPSACPPASTSSSACARTAFAVSMGLGCACQAVPASPGQLGALPAAGAGLGSPL